MTTFVAPTGYVDLDNDCEYSIDRKSTRSRESVDPKTDLAFYFDTYIVPKYGLNNINVNNVASFMKDLEMNWTKIDPEMKPKVLDIMVDSILAKDSSFKIDLLNKLGVQLPTNVNEIPSVNVPGISTFGEMLSSSDNDKFFNIAVAVLLLGLLFFLISKAKVSTGGYTKFI
jgi:hypothetical protein